MKKMMRKKFWSKCLAASLAFIILITSISLNLVYADEGNNVTGDSNISGKPAFIVKYTNEDAQALNDPYNIEDVTKLEYIQADFKMEIKNTINDIDGGAVRTVTEGDYLLYDFPSELNIVNSGEDFPLIDSHENDVIAYGKFEKTDGKLKLRVTFTDKVDDPDLYNISADMSFQFLPDSSSIGEGEEQIIEIPAFGGDSIIIHIKKPVPPSTTPAVVTKKSNFDQTTGLITWNITIGPETAELGGTVFTDVLDPQTLELVSVQHNSLLTEGIDYQYAKDSGLLEYTIPEGRNDKKITIVTRVKDSVYMDKNTTTVKNKALLTGGPKNVNVPSNETEVQINKNWISKSGQSYDGNKIKWTITANSIHQNIYDGVITDSLSADIALIDGTVKVDDKSITVYSSQAEAQAAGLDNKTVYGVYVKNHDDTSELKIYLPRTSDYASNKEYKVTLDTEITKPNGDTGTQEKIYTNKADFTAKFKGGTGTGDFNLPALDIETTGVSVPNVYIDKSGSFGEENRSAGTITWDVITVSNFQDYGKSVITDTLPEHLTYITDSVKIWNGSDYVEPEPSKVEVSFSEGDTKMKITFLEDNALKTPQKIQYKTKIADTVYRDNILTSREFKNTADVALYDHQADPDILVSDTDTHSVYVDNKMLIKDNENYTSLGDTPENPRRTFRISVNENKLPLENVTVKDDLDSILTSYKVKNKNNFTQIEDAVWRYVESSVKIYKNNNILVTDLTEIFKYDEASNELQFDFGDIADKYTITYTAQLNVKSDTLNTIFSENGTLRTEGNKAVLDFKDRPREITSAAGNRDSDNSVLIKNSNLEQADEQIFWTMNINQYGVDLISGTDKITISDTLSKGITLDPASLRFYEGVINEKGEFYNAYSLYQNKTIDTALRPVAETEFKYTYTENEEGNYVLEITFPDNKPYILFFATDVDSSLFSNGAEIKNNAVFKGNTSQSANTGSASVRFSSASGGSSERKKSVKVEKLSIDNESQKLPDAKFDLYWFKTGKEDPNPVYVRTLSTNDKGEVTFRGLTKGEFYGIKEIKAPEGYLLDNNTFTVFEVTDDAATISDIQFYNTPIKNSARWEPQAVKEFEGKSFAENLNFEFEVTDEDGNVIYNGVTNGTADTNKKDAVFTLKDGLEDSLKPVYTDDDESPFDLTDALGTEHKVMTKNYYIREKAETRPGYTYDDTVFRASVDVVNIKGQADLEVRTAYAYEAAKDNWIDLPSGEVPVFKNSYDSDGTLNLTVQKLLTGRELEEEQFTFELYEGDQLIASAQNGISSLVSEEDMTYKGYAVFDELQYTLADVGTKHYRLVEKNDNQPGYSYDTVQYDLTVDITDDDSGKLQVSVTVTKDGAAVSDGMIFHNTYEASGTFADLSALKILDGDTLKENQFTFLLTQVTKEGQLIEELERAKNDSEGKINFDKLVYTQNDMGKSYYYTISELIESIPGYTYDKSVYKVEVKVIDNGDGTLKTEIIFLKDGSSEVLDSTQVKFVNTYSVETKQPESGDYSHNEKIKNPKSGDYSYAGIYGALACASLGIIFLIWFVRRVKIK